ncbi:hypothetical protein [Paenibacillus sp. HW567]|uniref:hypothetical protein n=1 Tax=Paenibacillus sp. HW567 TaxID=1034769 RepID=UPI0012EB741D|nr:hypothetical protein [Paenibacillus sp. HW567]
MLICRKGKRAFVKAPLVLYLAVALASCGLVLGTGYYSGKMIYTDGVGVSANGVAASPPK